MFNETPTGTSRNEKYRRAAVRKSGDVKDSVENIYSIVRAGVKPVQPTGQHVATPHGQYHAPEGAGASPDPVVGAIAGAAMLAEAVRVVRERRRAKKRRKQDANG